MGSFQFDHLFDLHTGSELFMAALWSGLAALTITLVVLTRTRWGQSRPLRKCLALSLLAHLLMIGYATTIRIEAVAPTRLPEPAIRVSIVDGTPRDETTAKKTIIQENPWDALVHESVSQPEPVAPARMAPVKPPEPKREAGSSGTVLPNNILPERVRSADITRSDQPIVPTDTRVPRRRSARPAEPSPEPEAQRRRWSPTVVPAPPKLERAQSVAQSSGPPVRDVKTGVPSALLESSVRLPRTSGVPVTAETARWLAGPTDLVTTPSDGKPVDSAARDPASIGLQAHEPAAASGQRLLQPSADWLALRRPSRPVRTGPSAGSPASIGPPRLPRPRDAHVERQVPEIYRLRVAPDRSRLAERQGATSQSEAAVTAALKWLADNQSPDGRWDARTAGAGREMMVSGRDRQGAGAKADTAITALALLAFLASGHTHQKGIYQTNLRHGAEYLLRTQGRDGNLSGQATTFAAMYCHAMATFALCEDYAMSGDERLREPVRRAVLYTIVAQNPSTGGWRYLPKDPGDTSQIGWQLMALKSAELAGIPIPHQTSQGARRYLDSVSSGSYGGLAAYRPAEQPSRAMTAEALVCRQFLGMAPDHPLAREAGDYLLGQLPGEGKPNLYYWYYATLGTYQLQGPYWQRWNQALQATLVESQRQTGPMAGSWDPDTVWGGYGGRVYSTALATLCLEVYYRFLPLYVEAASADRILR